MPQAGDGTGRNPDAAQMTDNEDGNFIRYIQKSCVNTGGSQEQGEKQAAECGVKPGAVDKAAQNRQETEETFSRGKTAPSGRHPDAQQGQTQKTACKHTSKAV